MLCLKIGSARVKLFWSFGVSGVRWVITRLEARRRLAEILSLLQGGAGDGTLQVFLLPQK
jgi:hypothetical protein